MDNLAEKNKRKHLAVELGFFAMLALLLGCLLLVLSFGSALLKLSDVQFFNSGDTRLNFLVLDWIVRWFNGEVPPETASIFNFPIFHPYPYALSLSVNHFGSLPLLWLFELFSSDWFTRGNLWFYTCFLLNMLASSLTALLFLRTPNQTFRCHDLRRLDQTVIALVFGMAYAFSVPRLHFSMHPQTLPHFAGPFFLYFGWRALREGKAWPAFVSALFFSWQTLLDVHNALMFVLLALALMPVYFWQRLRLTQGRKFLSRDLRPLAIFIGVSALICGLALYHYLDTMKLLGARNFSRGPSEYHYLWPSALLLPAYNTFLGITKFSVNEDGIYLGAFSFIWLALLLTMLGTDLGRLLYQWVSKHSLDRKLSRPALVTLAATLPVKVYVDFIVHQAPYIRAIHNFVPGFSSLRTPGRFAIILAPLLFGATILAAIHRGWLGQHRRLCLGLIIGYGLCLMAEAKLSSFPQWSRYQLDHDLAELDNAFGTCARGPIAVLGRDESIFSQIDAVQMAMKHRVKVMNGYSGFVPPPIKRLLSEAAAIQFEVVAPYLLSTYYRCVIINNKGLSRPKNQATLNATELKGYLVLEGKDRDFGGQVANHFYWKDFTTYFPDLPKLTR